MPLPRLRQAVVAARDIEATMAALERALGVTAPFRDPGIVHFGLTNAVYAVGDTFVEVVSPVRDDTAAGRQIARNGGDCGYMCMFELADADAVRRRVADLGVRIVHDTTNPDIVDLHLHPKDVPGAIVALDVTDPVGSWRWGGPAWEGERWAVTPPAAPDGPTGLRGLVVAVADPPATARLWGALLDLPVTGTTIGLDGGRQRIEFVPAHGPERIVAAAVTVSAGTGPADVAGVTWHRIPTEDGS